MFFLNIVFAHLKSTGHSIASTSEESRTNANSTPHLSKKKKRGAVKIKEGK